ncbi:MULTISPECIES: LPS export ABC transporter periplasmic protein LptC [unclassified Meridianimarinicoccus]|uniref:LPS export ABC transporter periplasmic protein LptC n=1 Tax=unclassified Meridianimarinicoccus TaxID=2923344 RepID=UPI0018675E79|nr:LPS export ABC transporter periplasmic protein LptC [Fluviibacterium sp. MJW13]
MGPHGNTYSRLVVAGKILLPLGAIGLMSTMFLLARTPPEGEALRYADDSVSELAEQQRLGAPIHASVTEDGAEVKITAKALLPDEDLPRVTHGTDLFAELLTQDAQTYEITSRTGVMDDINMVSHLTEDVLILTSDGYRIRTDALELRSDLTYMRTLTPISADGPLGTLDAGQMEVFTDPEDDTRTRMLFTGGVRLVYIP